MHRSTEAEDPRAIVDAIRQTQAMIVFTPDGTILDANPLFLACLGYDSVEEIRGRPHRIFLDPAEASAAAYRDFWPALARGAFHQGDFRRLRRDGRHVWISATYTPVLDASGRVERIVKFAVDVTARRAALDALAEALGELAMGNIMVRLDDRVGGDLASVRDHYNEAADKLEAHIRAVMGSAKRIGWIVTALREGAATLAQRSEEQAAAVLQSSTALGQITRQLGETSKASDEADARARDAAEKSERGREIVERTIGAIRRIEEITNEVAKITRIIESFAFQTNLLSINAAVEAARAGDAGKGFAVVASEVRNLAQRSAEASKNIGELTARCVMNVAEGAQLAQSAGEALTAIGASVGDVVSGIAKIAAAAREQSRGLVEVETAVRTVEESLQSLTRLSGEGADNAEDLAGETGRMGQLVNHFTTREVPEEGPHMLPPGVHSDRREGVTAAQRPPAPSGWRAPSPASPRRVA
jgi:methyl-accepting chemotaxis protein